MKNKELLLIGAVFLFAGCVKTENKGSAEEMQAADRNSGDVASLPDSYPRQFRHIEDTAAWEKIDFENADTPAYCFPQQVSTMRELPPPHVYYVTGNRIERVSGSFWSVTPVLFLEYKNSIIRFLNGRVEIAGEMSATEWDDLLDGIMNKTNISDCKTIKTDKYTYFYIRLDSSQAGNYVLKINNETGEVKKLAVKWGNNVYTAHNCITLGNTFFMADSFYLNYNTDSGLPENYLPKEYLAEGHPYEIISIDANLRMVRYNFKDDIDFSVSPSYEKAFYVLPCVVDGRAPGFTLLAVYQGKHEVCYKTGVFDYDNGTVEIFDEGKASYTGDYYQVGSFLSVPQKAPVYYPTFVSVPKDWAWLNTVNLGDKNIYTGDFNTIAFIEDRRNVYSEDLFRQVVKDLPEIEDSPTGIGRRENFEDKLVKVEISANKFMTEGTTKYLPDNMQTFSGLPWAVEQEYMANTVISIETEKERIRSLTIGNGYYHEDMPDLYQRNSRPRKIRIDYENGQEDFSFAILEDKPEVQFVSLLKNVSKVSIKILSVYQGTDYDDICINYIGVIGTE